MAPSQGPADEPVALITQYRVRDAFYAGFTHWLARQAERLRRQPGFIAHEVIPPAPPEQFHWITVARFADAQAARAWLEDPERTAALAEIRAEHLLEEEQTQLLEDKGPRSPNGTSAFIAYNVPPAQADAFLAWQTAIQEQEARQPGFLRHKTERPVPGVRDEWIIILTFDSEANLSRWLDSPERRRLMAGGGGLNVKSRLSRTSYGFDFWFRGADRPGPRGWGIFKNNLLVLLVLNPIVVLWSLLVAGPVLAAHGMPPWANLFIGDLVSTQLLGWLLAPAAFKAFDWWLAADGGWRRTLLGYGLLAALYAGTMAGHAALLRLM